MSNTRRHRRLRILFKNGQETWVESPGGFIVNHQDGTITEDGSFFARIPYHDPNTIAAIFSEDRSDDQVTCSHPHCLEIIAPEEYACRDHWYSLPMHIQEPIRVARQAYGQRPSDQRASALEQAEKAADTWWRKHMSEETTP